jgi:hypothetical protein
MKNHRMPNLGCGAHISIPKSTAGSFWGAVCFSRTTSSGDSLRQQGFPAAYGYPLGNLSRRPMVSNF